MKVDFGELLAVHTAVRARARRLEAVSEKHERFPAVRTLPWYLRVAVANTHPFGPKNRARFNSCDRRPFGSNGVRLDSASFACSAGMTIWCVSHGTWRFWIFEHLAEAAASLDGSDDAVMHLRACERALGAVQDVGALK